MKPSRHQASNSSLFRALQSWVEANYPGTVAVEVSVKLSSGGRARLPVPAVTLLAARATIHVAAPTEMADGWRPNPVQAAILAALEGQALRSPALKELPGLEGRVFRKPGGIQELQDRGLVAWDRARGYWRPDAVPEGWEG